MLSSNPQVPSVCPHCNALFSLSAQFIQDGMVCPHCGNGLLWDSADIIGHDISEIDPDIEGVAMGVFSRCLHPVGTSFCGRCGQVFPHSFECCPGLVNLAFAAFNSLKGHHTERTDDRIVDFFRSKPKVVANTVQLRALELRSGKLKKSVFEKMRVTLQLIRMMELLREVQQ